MPVNAHNVHLSKRDVQDSIDMYKQWFRQFAPLTYRTQRVTTTNQVLLALQHTAQLTRLTPTELRAHPEIIPILRMATAPPLARDRLIGLAQVTPNLIYVMEEQQRLPQRMAATMIDAELLKVATVIRQLADHDIFPWLATGQTPTPLEVERAAPIVADRLYGALSDPIIRNAQEQRQLAALRDWLTARGYQEVPPGRGTTLHTLLPGTFTFRLNVPVTQGIRTVNIPVDAAVMRTAAQPHTLPLLIEAKSAGDFTNTNKRRKEEAQKMQQLRATYGPSVEFILFLCGYFDSGYLGYEAAEGIDWVWEHRIDDLALFGV